MFVLTELEHSQLVATELEGQMRSAAVERKELEQAQLLAEEARQRAEQAAHMEKEEREKKVGRLPPSPSLFPSFLPLGSVIKPPLLLHSSDFITVSEVCSLLLSAAPSRQESQQRIVRLTVTILFSPVRLPPSLPLLSCPLLPYP